MQGSSPGSCLIFPSQILTIIHLTLSQILFGGRRRQISVALKECKCTHCGPMLVTDPNVVWLLITVLVVAVVFVTSALASDCLLCLVFLCPRCVWMIHEEGLPQLSQMSSDGQVIWVARLFSNSKNTESPLLTNNKNVFLLKHVCETINKKQTMFAFLAKRRKNIERGRVTMRYG